jgi:hypothetical protein
LSGDPLSDLDRDDPPAALMVASSRRSSPRKKPRAAAPRTLAQPERPKLDPRRARTYPLRARASKVAAVALGRALEPGLGFAEWLERLPDILAARDLRFAADTIARARIAGRAVVLGMGAHAIKVGLAPILIDLLERGVLTGIALNGAGVIHDFEIAMAGMTSEDVGPGLDRGRFGMARETGAVLNQVISRAAKAGLGLGEAVGSHIERSRYPYKQLSLTAAAARLGVPLTVHVAVGTDIIHMHPSADGAAIGATSLRDFHRLAEVVAGLAGGVYINLGSAVVLPEVFVKALNLARNLGHRVRPITTIDLDFIRHYRPAVNVVSRPTASGGRGLQITGHHELLFPLLAGAILERLAELGAVRPKTSRGVTRPRNPTRRGTAKQRAT